MFTGEDKFLCCRDSAPAYGIPVSRKAPVSSPAGRPKADSFDQSVTCRSIYSITTRDRPEIRPL